MTDQAMTNDRVVQIAYAFAAEQMERGSSCAQVEGLLVENGLGRAAAFAIVSDLSEKRTAAIRAASRKNVVYGALWCIGGLIVTIVSYSEATDGGRYVVAYGAIVFGAIQLFRGLGQRAE
jgi:hypothetical protein